MKFNQTIKTKPMNVGKFSRSRVNIIIPFHGQYGKVSKLVNSILMGVKSNPYQICLVDDCSPNNFIDDFKGSQFAKNIGSGRFSYKPQIVAYRTPEQLGFAGALKYGFDKTEEPWVMFMHSDCVIENTSWMVEMGKSLLDFKEKGVRMVSARSNNPGPGAHETLRGKKTDEVDDFVLESGVLPLYCAMAHRDLFGHIGGFLKPYPFGWYEDEELSFRMRKHGFKQGVCGKSWVHHEGGATIEQLWKDQPETKEIMESNRDKCIADMESLV